MVNRIKQIMEHYGYSSTQFADRIGAQRSAMSHVLSGRNKPSLDFVLKIKNSFPEIALDWLIMGKGGMFTVTGQEQQKDKSSGDTPEQPSLQFEAKQETEHEETGMETGTSDETLSGLMAKDEEPAPYYTKHRSDQSQKKEKKQPEMIVFYYSDGTFKNYFPE